MSTDLLLRCRCGRVRGSIREITPARANHLVCYCDDCQCFPHALGCSEEVLDESGGTRIVQVSPSRIRITQGAEQVECLRLTEKGILRWFAGCCRTPMANALPTAQVPFAGVVHAFIDPAMGPAEREAAIGPVGFHVMASFAKGPVPEGAHPRFPPGMSLQLLFRLILARVRGEHAPSPFFEGGKPRATPEILDAGVLSRVRAAQEAWPDG